MDKSHKNFNIDLVIKFLDKFCAAKRSLKTSPDCSGYDL